MDIDVTEASRRGPVANARGAAMCALIQRYSIADVSRVVGKHHSSVHNFKNKHNTYMKYNDYAIAYQLAYDVLEGRDVPMLVDFESVKKTCLTQREEIAQQAKVIEKHLTQIRELNTELSKTRKYKELYFSLADRLGLEAAV